MDEKEKKVDEGWKDKVEKEKQEEPPVEEGHQHEIEPDFSFFVSTLAIQASIALGIVPNPVTQKTEENLPQAKLIIDTLGMIKEKTTGNLSTDEDSLIDNVLYDLRMHYLAKTKGGAK